MTRGMLQIVASLNDNSRGVFYVHMFVQATKLTTDIKSFIVLVPWGNCLKEEKQVFEKKKFPLFIF
jgi:hypothetical protein